MKKLILIALLTCSIPAIAMADTAPAATAPTTSATAPQKAERFDARKTKVLQRLSDRLSKLQQKQQCVQAATDGKAMKACFPDRGQHKGKKGCGT